MKAEPNKAVKVVALAHVEAKMPSMATNSEYDLLKFYLTCSNYFSCREIRGTKMFRQYWLSNMCITCFWITVEFIGSTGFRRGKPGLMFSLIIVDTLVFNSHGSRGCILEAFHEVSSL